jgi:hypothetical protein
LTILINIPPLKKKKTVQQSKEGDSPAPPSPKKLFGNVTKQTLLY